MKKFIFLFIFFAGNIFAQYNNYPYNLQNIEQYVNYGVTNYKTFDSGAMLSFAYAGKQVDADQYNNNTFRMIYSWDVSGIPSNAVVSTVTLYVNGTITTNSQANPYFYYYKITGFPDNKIQSSAQDQWTAINSAQVLDPQEQVAPIGGTFSGALTFASGSSFVTYVQNSLSQQKVHLAIVALDENWGNGVTINVSDFKINPGISTSSALKLKIDYTIPSSDITITVDNNFTAPNGTHGLIIVDDTTFTAPHTFIRTIGTNVNLQAVSPQTDNQGYQKIWHTGSVNKSEWKKDGAFKSNNQIYTFTVSTSDDNATYKANLRKITNITFQNNFIGVGNGGVIKVNGTQVSSPTASYSVVELNPITATAETQTINGITYSFSNWSNGSTNATTTFTPTANTTYTAYYKGKPTPTPNVRANDNIIYGNPIKIIWDDHPNVNVTQYYLYRKVKHSKYNSYEGPTLLSVLQRGTRSYTDYDYAYTQGYSDDLLWYDVRAYYNIENTFADSNYIATFGVEEGGGGGPILPKANDERKDILTMSNNEIPKDYYISQNYPNPFNPSTEIKYSLKKEGFVTIKVYDVLGRVVATLVNENKPAGFYTVNFDASKLSSGIYFYRITTNGFTAVKKMILTK